MFLHFLPSYSFKRISAEETEIVFASKDDLTDSAVIHHNDQLSNDIEMQEYPLSVIAFAQGTSIHTSLKPINHKKYNRNVLLIESIFNRS